MILAAGILKKVLKAWKHLKVLHEKCIFRIQEKIQKRYERRLKLCLK